MRLLVDNPGHAPGLDRVWVENGVKKVEMWVDYGDDRTTTHEWGHVKDVRSNWLQFVRDTAPKSREWDKSHDDRAHEQRANGFRDTVLNEVADAKKREKAQRKKKDGENQ